MKENFVEEPLSFWCSNYGLHEADVVFLGVPLDITGTFRTGTKEGPNRIRSASYNLETFSPAAKKDLKSLKMTDYGNVIMQPGNLDESLRRIRETVREISDRFLVAVGGEHTITLPVIQSLVKRHPDLKVLHFDAHFDLRDDYMGSKTCHATVMRRISEILGEKKIIHAGCRDFTEDEKEFAKKSSITKSMENLASLEVEGPVYISMDMDVFDPAYAPGVSTPVSGGIRPEGFFSLLDALKNKMEVVGFDVVETCPPYDHSDITSHLAAKVIREMILAFR